MNKRTTWEKHFWYLWKKKYSIKSTKGWTPSLDFVYLPKRKKKKTKEKKSTWKVCKSKFYERKCSHHILEDLKEKAYEKLSEVKKYNIKLPKNCVYQTINKLSCKYLSKKQKTFYSHHQQRRKNLFQRSLEQESRSILMLQAGIWQQLLW